MRGIEFINLADETFRRHTADDWDLVMRAKSIGTPALKTKYTNLNDRDGVLDHTDALTGVPAYETRELSFTFEYLGDVHEWTNLFTEIRNFLHGRRLKIFEPDDPDYYYLGRASVGNPTGGVVKTFEVNVKADTWKYRATGETTVTANVSAGESIILLNDWRPVSPTITTTGAASFRFNDAVYSIAGAGVFRFPAMRLSYGQNIIEIVSGSGEITFAYQEGAL